MLLEHVLIKIFQIRLWPILKIHHCQAYRKQIILHLILFLFINSINNQIKIETFQNQLNLVILRWNPIFIQKLEIFHDINKESWSYSYERHYWFPQRLQHWRPYYRGYLACTEHPQDCNAELRICKLDVKIAFDMLAWDASFDVLTTLDPADLDQDYGDAIRQYYSKSIGGVNVEESAPSLLIKQEVPDKSIRGSLAIFL